MTDLKTSLLVKKQVPEFIREEYPLFITFLEAYYEFLETAQGTQKNDVIAKSKDLKTLSDVDASIELFEQNFFNMYASLFPRDIQINRETLIKNVLPLYLARGNEKSFKLLFRMLFNDEVDVILPKNNILRASDGKWTVDNILKIETDVRSTYTVDGSNTTFYLAQPVNEDEIVVVVDDIPKTLNTDYSVHRESQKLIFNAPLIANSVVKVTYTDFNISLLNNRKITGVSSGATALVERATKKIITDRLNFGLPFELFINNKTLDGVFINGEEIITDIIGIDGNPIKLYADTFSILTSIAVTDGGAGYNVGDPVLILGGGASTTAVAQVDEVTTGYATKINIIKGGAGFKTASEFRSYIPDHLVSGAINGVDTSGANSSNYFIVTDELIDDYADVLISASDYGFPSNKIPAGENVSTRIYDALTSVVITDLGPITNAVILFSNTSTNTSMIDSEGAKYLSGNTFFDIKSFKAIGEITVYDGGSGYKIGDEVLFDTNPTGTFGRGGAAAVTAIDGTGKITKIQVQPQRISGTANILNNTIQITGTNTLFGIDVGIGDKIVIRSQEHYINAISSTTSATVNVAFNFNDGTTWANNYPIGSYSRGIVGGVNYNPDLLPNVSVTTAHGGSGANIAITSLMGDGEILEAYADTIAGEILSIKVLTGGVGYEYIPQIDLTNSGDGSATANAQIGASYTTLPGRWVTSDSILSSSERKIQGNDYYIDYSYVTSSLVQFSQYKNVIKELLHPAGFTHYSDLNRNTTVASNTISISTGTTKSLSGTVTITNGSIYVDGVNTLFNVANSLGTITIGTQIAINGELRIIASVLSNTNISVTSAFTSNSTGEPFNIVA